MSNRHTWLKLEMPNTKQIESKIFDLPLPFRPVIALKLGSNPATTRTCCIGFEPINYNLFYEHPPSLKMEGINFNLARFNLSRPFPCTSMAIRQEKEVFVKALLLRSLLYCFGDW